MKKLIVVALSYLSLVGLASAQQSKTNIQQLEQTWYIQNSRCRGSIQADAQLACEIREKLSRQLAEYGRCYGRKDEWVGAYKWHACDSLSNRSTPTFMLVVGIPRGETLNVRAAANARSKIVQERQNGEVLLVTDEQKPFQNGRDTWIKVCTDYDCMSDGWVNARFVKTVTPINWPNSKIPVAAKCLPNTESIFQNNQLSWSADGLIKTQIKSRVIQTLKLMKADVDSLEFSDDRGASILVKNLTSNGYYDISVSDLRLFEINDWNGALPHEDKFQCVPLGTAVR